MTALFYKQWRKAMAKKTELIEMTAKEEVKKELTEWLDEEVERRITDAVRKEVRRLFREMGRY